AFTFRMEERTHNVRLVPELGGGAAYDLGCYPIAFSRFVFNREPVAVLAQAELDPQFRVDMTAAGLLDFGGGRTAVFYTSFEVPGEQRARILGTRGEILLAAPYHPRRPEHVILLRRYRPESPEPEEERISAGVLEPFTAAVDNLGAAIRGEAELLLPPEDAIAQARVLDAVFQSAREGRRVRLD
ncbi:MAG TPA: Gfo/Idh/MocA family oxidoreductase, partial [Limnochorda sp.]